MTEEEIRKNFGENLLRLRKYNKMSQQELASELAYSDKAISKWELGDNIPDIFTLEKIAKLFNVTVDELIKPEIRLSKKVVSQKKKIMVTSISSGGGLLIGFIGLLVLSIIKDKGGISNDILQKFIFCCYPIALLIASIVLIVFTCLWFDNLWRFLAVSACLWSGAFIGMIWLDFSLIWIVIAVAVIIDILFGIFFFIDKENRHK